MIGIGYWKNLRWTQPGSPYAWADPQRIPTSDYLGQKARIVEFLRSGEASVRCHGYSHCRFEDCSIPETQMGSGNLTDGVFDWPEGLAHYVDTHNVALPDEFLHYVLHDEAPPTPDLWIRWSAQFRDFEPDPDPASADEVHTLADVIATPKYTPRFEEREDRWVIRHDDLVGDHIPFRSLKAIEAYLYAGRWGMTALSAAQARKIIGPLPVRILKRLTLGARVNVDAGQPFLYHGSVGVGMVEMDQLELRYRLRVSAEDWVPTPEAISHRYKRYWGC